MANEQSKSDANADGDGGRGSDPAPSPSSFNGVSESERAATSPGRTDPNDSGRPSSINPGEQGQQAKSKPAAHMGFARQRQRAGGRKARWAVGTVVAILGLVVAVVGLGRDLTDFTLDIPQSPEETGSAPTTSSAGTPGSAPSGSSTSQTAHCQRPVEVRDDFADGRVDPCRWDVAGTVTSTYHEQDGMRVYEREGLLVFEVGPHLETDGDVEIFAVPKGAVVEEVSMDLTLLQQESGSSGSVGLIAYLGDAEGDRGPMVRLDGGPGSNGAGYDFWWCPGYPTDYDHCEHDSPCDDLRLDQHETVRLRIHRTSVGIDSSIGEVACEVVLTADDIRSVNLNLYADDGSDFRMGVDNFYLRIRPS